MGIHFHVAHFECNPVQWASTSDPEQLLKNTADKKNILGKDGH